MQLMGRPRGLAGTAVTCFFASAMLAGCSGRAETQAYSPYSDFQAMSPVDMDSLRVKITYGGRQDQPVTTLAGATTGTAIPMALFQPFYRPGFQYSNDVVGPLTFTASRQELKRLIDNVGTVSRVTDGEVDPGGTLSFSLLSTAGGTTKVFE